MGQGVREDCSDGSASPDERRLLDGLDPAQRRAVSSPAAPLVVLAGAGSGKTRVLTRRIAWRCLNQDADPRHGLALTFTRKAAGELRSRLSAMGLRDTPAAGTFHATAQAQLRQRWAGADTRPPTLLEHKGRLLARLLGSRRRLSPGELAGEIEWAKARRLGPKNYPEAAAIADRRTSSPPEVVARLFGRYEEEKARRGVIDFDDLLLRCAEALERDPAFAAAQRWRFRHLFVDEFQDVNPLQYRLLMAWLGDRTDLCVVGDPNQAIYRWNGADPAFLVELPQRYPTAEVVELRDNYRSSRQVAAAATSVLSGPGGVPILVRTHRDDEPSPEIVRYPDETAEANGVARALRDHHGPRVPWSAQAVLVRTNGQTAALAEALRRARIPFRVKAGAHITDDPVARRVLGDLARARAPLGTALADLSEQLAEAADGGPSLSDDEATALSTLVKLGRELLGIDPNARAGDLRPWLATAGADRTGRQNAVEVASFHAAKGLEWSVVHVAGCESGLVPITHARTDEALAEERRLFYVAITRAARQVRFTWAESRQFADRVMKRRPSPYLDHVTAATRLLEPVTSVKPAGAARAAVADGRAALRSRAPAGAVTAQNREVLDALHRWRHGVARAAGVADRVILPDQTLAAVAAARPRRSADLDGLPGVGPVKVAEYGDVILELVSTHAP